MKATSAPAPPSAERAETTDDDVAAVRRALSRFDAPPRSRVEVRRPRWSSLHVLVVSPEFEGLSETAREESVWPLLETLDEEVLTFVTQVHLETPAEASSIAAEFDRPSLCHHRTDGLRELWAVTPRRAEGRFEAAFAEGRFPASSSLTYLTDAAGRRTFADAEDAARAAFAEARKQTARGLQPARSAA